MKTEHIILVAVGALLLARAHAQQLAHRTVTAADPTVDGSNWYEDQWARLHGRDLSLDGQHPAPCSYDSHGVTNTMGWAYGWDGSAPVVSQ